MPVFKDVVDTLSTSLLVLRRRIHLATLVSRASLTLKELENGRTTLDSGSDDANHVGLLLPCSHARQRWRAVRHEPS